jgi:PAT family beta-lactamase induction signal transducer AmpG
MTQAGYRFGLLVSGAGALYLATEINWSLVYGIMAVLILVGFITALLAPIPDTDKECEEPVQRRENGIRTALVAPFVEFFQRNNLGVSLLILAFILLYKFGDAFAGVMANPFYIKIGFTKVEIANVSKIFGVFATLVGVFAGGIVVKRWGILKSLLYCGILQMLSNLMFAAQAAVGSHVGFLFLTIGMENLSGGMGSAAFVAYLSLLCNTAYIHGHTICPIHFFYGVRPHLALGFFWLGRRADGLGHLLCYFHFRCAAGPALVIRDDEKLTHGSTDSPGLKGFGDGRSTR